MFLCLVTKHKCGVAWRGSGWGKEEDTGWCQGKLGKEGMYLQKAGSRLGCCSTNMIYFSPWAIYYDDVLANKWVWALVWSGTGEERLLLCGTRGLFCRWPLGHFPCRFSLRPRSSDLRVKWATTDAHPHSVWNIRGKGQLFSRTQTARQVWHTLV